MRASGLRISTPGFTARWPTWPARWIRSPWSGPCGLRAPLNGAVIVGFTHTGPDQFSLRYRMTGNATDYFWNYTLNRAGKSVLVTYVGAGGTTETPYPNWEPAPPLADTTLGVTQAAPGTVRLQLGGQAGRGYELQASEDLVRWSSADYLLLDDSGATNVVPVPTAGQGFFRVR